MPLNMEALRDAVRLIRDAGGAEAAIAAQRALDLAVTARFTNDGRAMTPEAVRKLLLLRLARHRAATSRPSSTIH
jgi:hypothetical protein